MRAHDRLFLASLPLIAGVLLTGCPADDPPAIDTETDTDPTGDGDPTTTGPDDASSTTNPDTTTGVDDTSTTDPDDTGPDPDSSTGEPPPMNNCIGLDQVGDIDSVFSRDGMPIDATCDATPMPCGGDVVGTWNIEDSCGYDSIPNPLEEDCPGSTFMIETLSHNGTLEFIDDGTFVQDLDIQSQVIFTLDPMACFGVDCATFEGFIQMDDPMASCVDMMGSCSCTFPPQMGGMVIMGNYQIMDTDLIFEVDGEFQLLSYCVNGDRLDTWSPVFAPTFTEALCNDEQDCIDELGDMHEFYLCEPPEME